MGKKVQIYTQTDLQGAPHHPYSFSMKPLRRDLCCLHMAKSSYDVKDAIHQ